MKVCSFFLLLFTFSVCSLTSTTKRSSAALRVYSNSMQENEVWMMNLNHSVYKCYWCFGLINVWLNNLTDSWSFFLLSFQRARCCFCCPDDGGKNKFFISCIDCFCWENVSVFKNQPLRDRARKLDGASWWACRTLHVIYLLIELWICCRWLWWGEDCRRTECDLWWERGHRLQLCLLPFCLLSWLTLCHDDSYKLVPVSHFLGGIL